MDDLVILSHREQEYLLRAIESAVQIVRRRQLFLWTQGQLQSLLPHELMVCLLLGDNNELLHVEPLHGTPLDPRLLELICDPVDGLALRITQHCAKGQHLPCAIEAGVRDSARPLSRFQLELSANKPGSTLVHGTGTLLGGTTFFLIFGLPDIPSAHHAYYFDLLLPYLHLAVLRMWVNGDVNSLSASVDLAYPVTHREIEILRWVKDGKSNVEIGHILGISALPVKNHLQKIYKKLGAQNRMQAVSRCMHLRLLENTF